MNGKQWLVHALRILITVAAAVIVVRMIRWHDYWILTDPAVDKPSYHDGASIAGAGTSLRNTL